ncbi:hypothetical protein JMJ77_0012119, partial [Colletotrichum scovillei]
ATPTTTTNTAAPLGTNTKYANSLGPWYRCKGSTNRRLSNPGLRPSEQQNNSGGRRPLNSASSEGSKAAPLHQDNQDLDVSSDLQLLQDCNDSNSPAKRRSRDRKGENSGQSAAVSVRRHTKSIC